jgi:aspartate carbamoyltransferase
MGSLTREAILSILDVANEFSDRASVHPVLAGRIACLMFFQSSTRTRLGFDVAVKRLGGSTTALDALKHEDAMGWAESLEDTFHVASDYSDVLVVRHPSSAALEHAVRYSSVPVINAGSGCEHHPTQALIDLYCIRSRLGRLDGLRIGIVGDLARSRAARSLVEALRYWPPAELRLMAPPGRSFEDSFLSGFGGLLVTHHPRLLATGLDVLYVAALPNPPDRAPYDVSLRAALGVTSATVEDLPVHGIILCPLPRLDEIDRDVDRSGKAAYFDQSRDGLRVRMAVLAHTCCATSSPRDSARLYGNGK